MPHNRRSTLILAPLEFAHRLRVELCGEIPMQRGPGGISEPFRDPSEVDVGAEQRIVPFIEFLPDQRQPEMLQHVLLFNLGRPELFRVVRPRCADQAVVEELAPAQRQPRMFQGLGGGHPLVWVVATQAAEEVDEEDAFDIDVPE